MPKLILKDATLTFELLLPNGGSTAERKPLEKADSRNNVASDRSSKKPEMQALASSFTGE
jgi:hypothetical protein